MRLQTAAPDIRKGLEPQAPAIAGRGFTITAAFDAQAPEGVVVAQGGSARGYALFLRKGKLAFAVRAKVCLPRSRRLNQ